MVAGLQADIANPRLKKKKKLDRIRETKRGKEKLDKVMLSQSAHLTLLTFFPWQEIIQSNQLGHSWDGNDDSVSSPGERMCEVRQWDQWMAMILLDEIS